MKERPILFSAPMVRAILEGRKTQTRRVVSPPPTLTSILQWAFKKKGGFWLWPNAAGMILKSSPYGVPGDLLWVKEAWTGCYPCFELGCHLQYAADGSESWVRPPEGYVFPKAAANAGKWVTPLFMPRWASRITLEIEDVRVQRVQEISEEDARDEGCEGVPFSLTIDRRRLDASKNELSLRADFCGLWDSINDKRGYGWDKNPWVWAITFRRVV